MNCDALANRHLANGARISFIDASAVQRLRTARSAILPLPSTVHRARLPIRPRASAAAVPPSPCVMMIIIVWMLMSMRAGPFSSARPPARPPAKYSHRSRFCHRSWRDTAFTPSNYGNISCQPRPAQTPARRFTGPGPPKKFPSHGISGN